MRFKLVECFESNSLTEETLDEGYRELWSQFAQVAGIQEQEFDLHHIYQDGTSKSGKNINFVILPRTIHRRFPKNKNREDSVALYKQLKKVFPNNFKKIRVTFEIFEPQDADDIATQLIDMNKKRKNSQRRKHNKLSSDDMYTDLVDNGQYKEV